MTAIAIAQADELKPGQMKRVQVNGKRLLLANADGHWHLVDEMCTHEDYSLYLGCIKNGKIKCSLHGSYFDLSSGEPTCDPACEPINTYPTWEENGQIWTESEL